MFWPPSIKQYLLSCRLQGATLRTHQQSWGGGQEVIYSSSWTSSVKYRGGGQRGLRGGCRPWWHCVKQNRSCSRATSVQRETPPLPCPPPGLSAALTWCSTLLCPFCSETTNRFNTDPQLEHHDSTPRWYSPRPPAHVVQVDLVGRPPRSGWGAKKKQVISRGVYCGIFSDQIRSKQSWLHFSELPVKPSDKRRPMRSPGSHWTLS